MPIQQPMNQFTVLKPAVTLRLDQVDILFREEYAYAYISLLDEDGAVVSRQTIAMQENELSGWGADDTFVLEVVKNKLGI